MDFTVFFAITAIVAGGVSAMGAEISEAFYTLPQPYLPPVQSSYTIDLSSEKHNEVLSVTLDEADNANVTNMNVNVLHSEVVGLFGSPVEISADEFDGAKLTFRCNPDNMSLVPMDNLIVLTYNEHYDSYHELSAEVDSEDYTVTLPVDSGGVYLLADGYEWYSVWGEDVSRFEAHDTLLSGSDYTPEFRITLPKFIQLSETATELGQNAQGFDFSQFAGTSFGANPAFAATYMTGEDIWQFQCDDFAQLLHNGSGWTQQEYELENGAQAKLYLLKLDESSRGGPVGAIMMLHVKVSDDKLLSFGYSITAEEGLDYEQCVLDCEQYLRTFEWVDEPNEEAFTAAAPWDITQHPEVSQEPPAVQLTDYAYTHNNEHLPQFTIRLPDCVSPNPRTNPISWEDENGITSQMLMFCNQSDDIYYDFELYSDENIWERRLIKDEFIFNIEGESHTVEDISRLTGCDSEIYVLRFADTGKVESSHLQMYVFGIYKKSETEIVVIRCDLWTDTANEYLPLALESLRSFRFTE